RDGDPAQPLHAPLRAPHAAAVPRDLSGAANRPARARGAPRSRAPGLGGPARRGRLPQRPDMSPAAAVCRLGRLRARGRPPRNGAHCRLPGRRRRAAARLRPDARDRRRTRDGPRPPLRRGADRLPALTALLPFARDGLSWGGLLLAEVGLADLLVLAQALRVVRQRNLAG